MSDHGPVCVKTGCLLKANHALYWGDLHSLGPNTLIFNAVRHNSKSHQVDPADFSPEACLVSYNGPFFERVGVFVLLESCCTYNAPFEAHFAEWGGPR